MSRITPLFCDKVLQKFKDTQYALDYITLYLWFIWKEADNRGWNYDKLKIGLLENQQIFFSKHEQNKIRVIVNIIEMDEPQQVTTKFGNNLTVQHCKVKDEKDNIGYLALWQDQVGNYSIGDKIELINGFSKLFEGNVNISSGKTGVLRKI